MNSDISSDLHETVQAAIRRCSSWLVRFFSEIQSYEETPQTLRQQRLLLAFFDPFFELANSDVGLFQHLKGLEWKNEQVREIVLSKKTPVSLRIMRSIGHIGQQLGLNWDGLFTDQDQNELEMYLRSTYNSDSSTASRQILFDRIESGDFQFLSLNADFWADIYCLHDEFVKLGLADQPVIDTKQVSRFIQLQIFKSVSMRDIERLAPLLRCTGVMNANGGDCPKFSAAIRLLCLHIFNREGASSHISAYRLANKLEHHVEDWAEDVSLPTTFSTLETLITIRKNLIGLSHSSKESNSETNEVSEFSTGRIFDTNILEQLSLAEHRAFGWVLKNKHAFSPNSYGDKDKFEFSVKMFAELAFVCSQYKDYSGSSVGNFVTELQIFTSNLLFESPGLKSFLLQNLATLPGYSIYASLEYCGFKDAEFREKLVQLSNSPNIVSGEYGPTLHMDIAHSVARCGIDWNGPSIASLFERSLLNAAPDFQDLKDPEYYAITHAIFFATDFGLKPNLLDQYAAQHFCDNVSQSLFYLSSRGHWDLVGELLLCQIYLEKYDKSSEKYLSLILASQNEDGSICCREDETSISDSSEAWKDTLTKYHTTLVFLLVVAAFRFGRSIS